MKKLFSLIISLSVYYVIFGADDQPKYKHTIGVVFGPGYISASERMQHIGLRGAYSTDRFFSVGAEAVYLQAFSRYGNSDYYGVIGFARLNPWKGFFAEIGLQYYNQLSKPRNNSNGAFFQFASLGYKAKISDRAYLEFQFRPFINNDNLLRSNLQAKCFMGFNVAF